VKLEIVLDTVAILLMIWHITFTSTPFADDRSVVMMTWPCLA